MRFILAAVVALSTWSAGSVTAQDGSDAQSNPIVIAMNTFRDAYNAGDVEALLDLYLEDAVMLMPQSNVRIGHDAIAEQYQQAFENGVGNLRLNMREVKQIGPEAALEVSETLIDAPGRTVHGRHMHIWIRSDGEWKLSRDMYHVLAVRETE